MRTSLVRQAFAAAFLAFVSTADAGAASKIDLRTKAGVAAV